MDGRAHTRLVVDRSAVCRSFNDDVQIVVYNLSPSGCLVARREGSFSPGETLLITLVGDVEVVGEVVWQRAPYGGVRFSTELPARVVEFLGFKNRDRRLAEPAPHDLGSMPPG
jgi:hypothetical protein